jgi:hypothetical protein
MFDVRDREFLGRLNSATKYPETPTYHFMEKKSGLLQEDQTVDFGDQRVQVTEKIDGTNGRIVTFPRRSEQAWVIGSREELLTCSEDHMINPNLGIVDALTKTTDEIYNFHLDEGIDGVRVYFFEVYGGSVGQNAKQYTKDRELYGARMFDVIEFDLELFEETMAHGRESIASWRDRGCQPFLGHDDFLRVAQETNLLRVPVLNASLPAMNLPKTFQEAAEFMRELLPDGSEATLTPDALGRPEGVVLKSHDRQVTAKMRFVDYESTVRRMEDAAKKKVKMRLRDAVVE